MLNIKSGIASVCLGASLLLSAPAMAETELKPSGTITIDQTQFGLIIGGNFGGGELTFDGKVHKFKLGGLSLGANIGVSQLEGKGEVYNLKDIKDFPGNYVSTGGQATAVRGMGGMQLQNAKGVILRIDATTEGLQFNVGAGGVNIYFD
jgi:hypothetical protein